VTLEEPRRGHATIGSKDTFGVAEREKVFSESVVANEPPERLWATLGPPINVDQADICLWVPLDFNNLRLPALRCDQAHFGRLGFDDAVSCG